MITALAGTVWAITIYWRRTHPYMVSNERKYPSIFLTTYRSVLPISAKRYSIAIQIQQTNCLATRIFFQEPLLMATSWVENWDTLRLISKLKMRKNWSREMVSTQCS